MYCASIVTGLLISSHRTRHRLRCASSIADLPRTMNRGAPPTAAQLNRLLTAKDMS